LVREFVLEWGLFVVSDEKSKTDLDVILSFYIIEPLCFAKLINVDYPDLVFN